MPVAPGVRCKACKKIHPGSGLCQACKSLANRARGSSTARGYGVDHRKVRAHWVPLVAAGLVDCARCGKRIAQGQAWDLGHRDEDRTRYAGPECTRCNRAVAGRRAVD